MSIGKTATAVALAMLVSAAPAAMAKNKKGSKSNANSVFSSYDRNGDGVITRAEFGGDVALFDRVDRNRDGRLSRSEAKNALNDRALVEQQMRGLDRNRDGVISRSEWNGNSTSFARLDRNGDGILSQADRTDRTRDRDDDGQHKRHGRNRDRN
jgi:hypothetical protein